MEKIKIPIISVILSVYKEPLEWIEKSVNSILTQTFSNFEFIIINDFPARLENKELILKFVNNDSRVLYVENEKNIGLTASLNKGLDIASGKYIARMDADDISVKERFQVQYDFMEENLDIILCGSNAHLINEEGIRIGELLYPSDSIDIKETLILKNCLAHPTFFYRKSIIDKYNIRYSEEYPYAEDYHFLTKLIFKGKFFNFEKKLLYYRKSNIQIGQRRITEQNITANKVRKQYVKALIKSEYDIDVHSECLYNTLLKISKSKSPNKILINSRLSFLLYFGQSSLKERLSAILSFNYSVVNSLRLLLNK
ncbi:glycosyltransferase [Flavobacteriaceae bacterium]|nr:glycosyltransferase [Flavobacteriaceae bacterium]